MRKHTIIVAVITIVAVSAVAIVMMRSRLQWTPPADLEQLAEQTANEYNKSDTLPTSAPDRVAAALGAAPVTQMPGSEPLPEKAKSSLDTFLAEFLHLRALGDADKYADWMRSRGSTLTAHAPDGPSGPMIGHRFKHYLGRERTPEDTPWDVFRLLFEAECSLHGPTDIVTRPDSAEYLTGVFTTASAQSYNQAIFEGIVIERMMSSGVSGFSAPTEWTPELANIHWYMGQTYVGISHWNPKLSAKDILERNGAVRYVEAHFITNTKSGSTIPTVVNLYYDATEDAWIIDSMHYVNTYALALGLGAHF